MKKSLKYSVILLATILFMVPATVSISQITDMEKANVTLNVNSATVNEIPILKLATGTTPLYGTAGQVPLTMIIIGIGLIAAAGIIRKRLEKTINLNSSTTKHPCSIIST